MLPFPSDYSLLKGLGIHIKIKILRIAQNKCHKHSLQLGRDCWTVELLENTGVDRKMLALVGKLRIAYRSAVTSSRPYE